MHMDMCVCAVAAALNDPKELHASLYWHKTADYLVDCLEVCFVCRIIHMGSI